MDIGIDKLKSLIQNMATLSEETISDAIDSYYTGKNMREEIFASSSKLRILEDEVSELSVELIARYQPVATSLRFIKSCMEISYGFSRFGRYAYDIAQLLDIFGGLSDCDHKPVKIAGNQTKEMINLAIKSFTSRDISIAKKIRDMDTLVDEIYMEFIKSASKASEKNLKCTVSGALILRYIERAADHATYIGDSVVYIVSGDRVART